MAPTETERSLPNCPLVNTRIVDQVEGKIGNAGRILKAGELVLAYDLDAHLWPAVCVYQGTKKLSEGVVEIAQEML